MSIIQTIVQTSDLFFEITSNQENLDIRTLIGNTLYNSGYRKRVIIPSSVTVGSPSTGAAAIQIPTGLGGELVIDNYGSIQGAGGGGGGGTGGDAILAQSVCRVNNKPTGTIYAGGGGGGNGGEGGAGGSGQVAGSPYTFIVDTPCRSVPICPTTNCPAAAPVFLFCHPTGCTSAARRRCQGTAVSPPTPYQGGLGGSGGSGGRGRGYDGALASGSTGGSGAAGETNAGSGGTGGTGGAGGDWGASGATGSTGSTGSNGNVSNGLAGSGGAGGGAAGYYINGLSTYVTLTNNGTVLGRTN